MELQQQPEPREELNDQASVNLTRYAGVASLAVMGSRLMGLVREQTFAVLFGAGREYDSFLTAFRIPNMLRDLFAEGALSASFVTTLTTELSIRGEKRGFRLANRVLTAQVLILLVLCFLGILISPWIVNVLAPGFRLVPGKAELTTLMTRIMFPYLILVGAAAVAMGVLNAKGRFGVPHSASTFFNAGSIAGGILFGYLLDPAFGPRAIVGMALGTILGGILQFACQIPSLSRLGFRFSPEIDLRDPQLAKVFSLMTPALIGSAAVHVNILVNNNFASYLGNGAVSWLNYAFRLVHLPVGIFGVAIMSATTPALSRAMSRKDLGAFRETLASSLKMSFFFCMPSLFGLIVLSEPIVRLIYQHGRFTPEDTHQTAIALACYAIGLVAYAGNRLLYPAFLAIDDAKSPMYVSLSSIAANFFLNWLFVRQLGVGHWGLALSASFVSILNFGVLLRLIRRRSGGMGDARIGKSAATILFASVLMSITLWIAAGPIENFLGQGPIWNRLLSVLISISLGVGTYLLFCKLFGVKQLDLFLHEISRLRART